MTTEERLEALPGKVTATSMHIDYKVGLEFDIHEETERWFVLNYKSGDEHDVPESLVAETDRDDLRVRTLAKAEMLFELASMFIAEDNDA